MAKKSLNPLNDFVRTSVMEYVDDSTGAILPLASGTVTGFLALSDDPNVAAADPSLSCNGTYIGGANGYEAGTWLFKIDAAALLPALLDSLFTTTPPWFIAQRTSSVRVVEALKYVRARKATIV